MSHWKQQIAQVGEQLEKDLELIESNSLDLKENNRQLKNLEVQFLAKKGVINQLMRQIADVEPVERPEFGRLINELKARAATSIGDRLNFNLKLSLSKRLSEEKIDVTLPGKSSYLGSSHPVQSTMTKGMDVLREMGFSLQWAPEIDTEFFMFDALNFPKHHPARDMQDTFYLTDSHVLRSQTTNAQVHLLQKVGVPIRVAVAGRVYRNETVSARSLVTFHQIDVLVVDQDLNFGDLLSHLELFFRRFLERDVQLRIRMSYFPFVQPGVEVDISCLLCDRAGCAACKYSGWIEVCGAGMVHPNVLKNGGVNPEKWSGFAWGVGIERLVMLKYGIRDIRQLVQNDMRNLSQFEKL